MYKIVFNLIFKIKERGDNMSRTSRIILVTIVATVILLGLGYAAIQNITLNITGTATAGTKQDNFKVVFTGIPVVSESKYATASITDGTNAKIDVTGLTQKGQYVTVTYDIVNNSGDLSADLNVVTSNTNEEYFLISSKLGKSSLKANETTTVLVTVELLKTPINGAQSSSIGVQLTAMPVQPGNEGTSVGTNDYDQTPELQNEYGFYYDIPYSTTLENGVVETAIFYEDGSVASYQNNIPVGVSAKNEAVYGAYQIDVSAFHGEGAVATVSSDGKQLKLGEAVYTLNKSFMDMYKNLGTDQNGYGFYYGQAYTGTDSNGRFSYVFYEDGTVKYYSKDLLVSTLTATYSSNTIKEGSITWNVSTDGFRLTTGSGLVLDPTFWARIDG